MLRHTLLAAVSAAVLLSGPDSAAAADMAAPPPVYAAAPGCSAPIALAAPLTLLSLFGHRKKTDSDYVRIRTVTPYAPGCPDGEPAGIYVPPRTAYLASSPTRFSECVWPCRDKVHRDWYDGKLWYYNAGTIERPDVFMIVQRD